MHYLWSKFQQVPAIFGGERFQKSSEKKPKNWFFSLISWKFQGYIVSDTLSCTASLVEISKESDSILGSYNQKTTHKQPKIHFSGPMKT